MDTRSPGEPEEIFSNVADELQAIVGHELSKARQRAGLTQEEFGGLLGQNQSYVSRYESGLRRLDLIELVQICQALSADPNRILAGIVGLLSERERTSDDRGATG